MGRLNLETEVRLGISRNEFRLFYQPIIDINTSETFTLRGFEALVRWQHPKQGLIGPHLLIPVAEETGLIVELGEMIFDMACLQLMEWQQSKFDISNLKLSINLSGKQLMSPDLLSMIKRRISRSNVDPQKIKLEITESILLEQDYQAIHILNNLRDFGFEISLDDFGTGYSSLSYLQRLPIDTLKIDRSFIQKIQNDVKHKNFAIVQAIITLSHALGLNVIAEGVETKEQLEKLQFLQCEYVQGYLFAPPVDVVAATEFLKARIIEI
jgi:EAL domain-containing protein (putative c-di-GMP-specific phosphodiesterase class I)